jgi:hypothetical protein
MESFKWLGGDMSSHDKELLEAALEEQVNSAESKDEIVAQLGINPDDHRRQATFFAKEIDFLRGEPLPNERLISLYKQFEVTLKQLSAVEDFYNTQAKLSVEERKIEEGDTDFEKVTIVSSVPRDDSSREFLESVVKRRTTLIDTLGTLEKALAESYPQQYDELSYRMISEIENRTN